MEDRDWAPNAVMANKPVVTIDCIRIDFGLLYPGSIDSLVSPG